MKPKIGVRAHDYGKHEIKELAAILKEEGYDTAQLVLPKAFKEIDSYEDITLAKIEQIRKAFEAAGIAVSVFGCYMDMGNPDPDVRAYAVSNYKKCLNWAKELGADVVGTETAYPHLTAEEKKIWQPYMLDSICRITEEAARIDMRAAIEPVSWHPLCSLAIVQSVLEKIQDPAHLRLIFDASNLLCDPDGTDQNAYWNSWLNAVGDYVDVLHVKDFSLGPAGEYVPQPLGKGVIDYSAISRWLGRQDRPVALIREEMNPAFAKEDLTFLRNL